MNIFCIRILFLFLLYGFVSFSQNNFETLGETEIALNHSFNSKYKANFAAKSRYYLYEENNLSYRQRQLDVVHFSTLKLNYNHSISLGVQYRNRVIFSDNVSNELRLTQQFNYTKKPRSLRFGHRLRNEQRLLKNQTVFRQRYRFAIDFPLNGEKLDVGETYLVSSTELLLSTSTVAKPEWDHRLTSQLGWQILSDLKLQLGLEYRFEAFNLDTEQRLFILTSAVLNI